MSGELERQLAIYLADPPAAPAPAPEIVTGAELPALLKLLARNKVPLLAITPEQGAVQRVLHAQPPFIQAQAAERDAYESLRAEYVAAKRLWQHAGIADILIKSGNTFPSFPHKTSNLDVLVPPQMSDWARCLLRDNGYIELRNVEENAKYLFRKFHRGREISGLHVHEHVGWYASFLDEQRLWERCQPSADDLEVTVPSPEDIVLITIAHSFFEDKDVKLSDLAKVNHHLRERGGDFDWQYVEAVATRRSWREGLQVALLIYDHVSRAWYGASSIPPHVRQRAEASLPTWLARYVRRYLQREPAHAPFRIPFALSKYCFLRRLWQDPDKPLRRRLADLFIHSVQGTKLRLRLHSQPGMLVCFSGVDGSGKTAHAHALQRAFAGCHIHTGYVWGRTGSARWLHLLGQAAKRLAGQPLPQGGESEASKWERRRAAFGNRWVRRVWSWLTAVDLVARYTWQVRLPLLRGRVVLCDRYVYDAWVEWAAYFGGSDDISRTWAARWLRWAAPRPHRSYLLDIPAELAASRSSSAPSLAMLHQEVILYHRLAASFGAIVKDAQRPAATLEDEIAYETLTAYFDRYGTLVNALFFRNPGPLPTCYADSSMPPAQGRS